LATTGLFALLTFSSRFDSLDSHLRCFFFREQEKRESAEARNKKDDLKLCLFLVNVSFSQFDSGLIYPKKVMSFFRKKCSVSMAKSLSLMGGRFTFRYNDTWAT